MARLGAGGPAITGEDAFAPPDAAPLEDTVHSAAGGEQKGAPDMHASDIHGHKKEHEIPEKAAMS